MQVNKPHKKLFTQAFLFILFPVITITAAYSYIVYKNNLAKLNADVDLSLLKAEKQVKEVLMLMDKATDLSEDLSNLEMKNTSTILFNKGAAFEEELKRNNINASLSKLNIDTIDYEFYLIDASLKVIKSNNPKEIGYELGSDSKEIKQEFINLKNNSSFIVDRAAYSDIDNSARKFCYQGSPSKKYIYEFSIYPKRQKQIIADFFRQIDSNNVKPYLTSLAIFYGTKKIISPNINASVPLAHQPNFLKTLSSGEPSTIIEKNNDLETTYKYSYMPMQKGVFVNGWIIQIVSNNQLKLNLFHDSLVAFLKNLLIFSAILLVLLLIGIKLITNPLKNIINTINEIKNGNLKKRITINSKNELGVLASQFNQTINELEESKQHLETKVEQRTIELKEANMILARQKNDKELLIKETHHRVKNNLQLILSLIRLQKNESEVNKVLLSMSDIENRVMTLAAVHDSLYSDNTGSITNASQFVTKLVEDIFKSINQNNQITYTLDIDGFDIHAKDITTLGLLINELITNSFKYAFINKKEGNITIKLKKENSQNTYFFYSDDGVGFNKNLIDKESLGLFLIENFSEQLGEKILKLDVPFTAYEAHFEL